MADLDAAGAATPSAELRKRIAATLHMGLDDATPNDWHGGYEAHRSWVTRVQEWADWIHEQYAPHLVTADDTMIERRPHMQRRVWKGEDGKDQHGPWHPCPTCP